MYFCTNGVGTLCRKRSAAAGSPAPASTVGAGRTPRRGRRRPCARPLEAVRLRHRSMKCSCDAERAWPGSRPAPRSPSCGPCAFHAAAPSASRSPGARTPHTATAPARSTAATRPRRSTSTSPPRAEHTDYAAVVDAFAVRSLRPECSSSTANSCRRRATVRGVNTDTAARPRPRPPDAGPHRRHAARRQRHPGGDRGVWGAMERKVRLATVVSGVSERPELAPSDRFRYGERVASQQVDVLVAER